MHHEFPFLSLLLITGLAALLPWLNSLWQKLSLPLIVVEILAGIVVGRSGFDVIETGPAVDFLAMFGFTYLMFLSGLEMDYSMLSPAAENNSRVWRLGRPLSLGLLTFGLTLAGALLMAFGLAAFDLVQHPLFMALILSTTSLGVAVPVLKERDLTTTRYGQTVMVSAVVADFGTMLLITVVAAAISRGLTLDLLLILLLIVAFALVVRLGRLAKGVRGMQRLVEELAHSTSQIQVRATFALMVAFIALSRWLGTEIILGAFLAGTVISLLTGREGSTLHVKMEAIGYGFFIPVFFIVVGVRFDLPALLASSEALVLVPILLLGAYAVKSLPALVYRAYFSWRETLAAGMLLSARLSLIIAAASIALDLGAITEAINAAIVLLAIVTCTLSPVLFNQLLPPQLTPARRGIILAGLGQLPTLLAQRLSLNSEPVTLVGTDARRITALRRRNLTVVDGDPTDPTVLQRAGAESVAALMALSSPDAVNLDVCRLARDTFDIPHVIALASDPVIAERLSELGVRVVQPQLATALAIEGALHFPATFDMLGDRTDNVTVREAVLSNRLLDGHTLRRIRLPGGALVLGMRRQGEVLVPRGDTVAYLGDILMLVGDPEGLQRAIKWLNPSSSSDQAP